MIFLGEYFWISGKSYDGDWKRGFMDGIGKLVFEDGAVYQGAFKEGKKNGPGVVTL